MSPFFCLCPNLKVTEAERSRNVSEEIKAAEFNHTDAGLYLYYGQSGACQLFKEWQAFWQ